jgi:L-amino acid N-acyltransferase YncA
VSKDAVAVRDATKDDMPAVQAIYEPYVLRGLATFEEVPPDLAELTRRLEAVRAAGLPYLVCQMQGVVAGYAYAGEYRARPAYRHTVEDSVYVHEGLRGRGVGRALLAELVARCEQGRWRQMLAVIGDSANAGSIRLHASLGFSHVGVLTSVGFKLGRWVDTVLMQRALGPGDARPAE